MRKGVFIGGTAALMSLALLGCTTLVGGETVVKYDAHGTTPVVMKSTTGGQYALYESGDITPKIVVTVEAGEDLGFEKSEAGQLLAVAGDQEIPVNPAETYYWKKN